MYIYLDLSVHIARYPYIYTMCVCVCVRSLAGWVRYVRASQLGAGDFTTQTSLQICIDIHR